MTFEQLAQKYNLVQNKNTLPNYISFVYPHLPHAFNGALIYCNVFHDRYFIASRRTIWLNDNNTPYCLYSGIEKDFETVEDLDEYMAVTTKDDYKNLISTYKRIIQENILREIEVDFV